MFLTYFLTTHTREKRRGGEIKEGGKEGGGRKIF